MNLATHRASGTSRADRGASSVEYGIVLAAVAAVIVAVVFGLGQATDHTISKASSCLAAGSASTC